MNHAKQILCVAMFILLALGMTGCSGGGDSGGVSSLGYKVTLNATQSTIDPGGSLTIIATVTKNGQTAEDGTTVIFTSSLGGSFSGGSTASAAGDDDTSDDDTSGNTTGTASTTNGVATIVYTASSDLTGNDRITATVYDAYATVDIYIRSL